MATERLAIIIDATTSGAQKAFRQIGDQAGEVGKKLDGVGSKFKTTGQAMGLAGAKMSAALTLPLAAVGKAVFQAASDVNESLNKVNVIFGESAKGIDAWAKGAATSLGISRGAALDAAGTLGNMFTQLGVGQGEAGKLSTKLVGLAADLGSFHNVDPTQVLESVTSAFRGEYDAVQKFVPTINAAAVEQKALAMTGKDTAKALTAQEKALAVNALLFEGAGKAAGDFARTSDSAANKQKVLRARFQDTAASLGQALLPIGEKVLGWLAGLAEKFNQLSPGVQKAIVIFAAVAAAIGPVVGVVGALVTAVGFLISPVGLVVAAVALLAVGLVKLYQESETFRDIVDKAFAVAKAAVEGAWDALQRVWGWVSEHWPLLLGILTGPFGLLAVFVARNFDSIVEFVRGLPGRIAAAAVGMWDGIKNAFRDALNWIIRGWNNLDFRIPGFKVGPVGYSGFTLGMPDIPELAAGGIVRARKGGTLALLGEGGRDEAVIPLGAGMRGAGITYVTFNVQSILTPEETDRARREWERRNGRRN